MPFWTRKKEFFNNMHGPPLQYCLPFGPKHKTFTTDILKVLAIILLNTDINKLDHTFLSLAWQKM